jgi:hypothetical protein
MMYLSNGNQQSLRVLQLAMHERGSGVASTISSRIYSAISNPSHLCVF